MSAEAKEETVLIASSENLTVPPPTTGIYTVDWNATPNFVRRVIWELWLNFHTLRDGEFRHHLKDMIDKADITQKTLAERVGIGENEISRWLQGRKIAKKESRTHIPQTLQIVKRIARELESSLRAENILIRAYALEILWLKGFGNEG